MSGDGTIATDDMERTIQEALNARLRFRFPGPEGEPMFTVLRIWQDRQRGEFAVTIEVASEAQDRIRVRPR